MSSAATEEGGVMMELKRLPCKEQAGVLRNIFRPVTHWHIVRHTEWLTPLVLNLAQQAYDLPRDEVCGRCKGGGEVETEVETEVYYVDGPWIEPCPDCHGIGKLQDGTLDPNRLAVLSDALEEAGCDNEAILQHLRSSEPHVRGCWALDLILGKS